MSRAALRLATLMVRDPAAAQREASRIRSAAKASQRRKAERAAPRIADETRQEAEAQARHDHLVALVMARAAGRCELGDHDAEEMDPHHLEGGSGRRRQGEWVGNVMAACRSCHDAYHLNVRAFVARVVAWCKAYGYPLPRRKEFRS